MKTLFLFVVCCSLVACTGCDCGTHSTDSDALIADSGSGSGSGNGSAEASGEASGATDCTGSGSGSGSGC